MRYEREQLGDGFSVPCARLRVAGNGGRTAVPELAAEIFRLVDTEVISLDNMLTAHGRSTFTGSRRLFAALGDRLGTAATESMR